MGFGFGDILSLGGAVLGAVGSKKDKPAEQKSAFDSLPKEVQDAWLKTYIPQVMAQSAKPYKAMPMKRYKPTGSVFDSKAMEDLQQYSDSIGGLFSPLNGAGAATPAPTAPAPAPFTPTPQGVTNKSSGTYYNWDQAKNLASQGITSPSFVAYIQQMMDAMNGGAK